MKKKNIVKEENKRRMLERRRFLDYLSLHGLSAQTGCDPRDLDTFALKELVDNALDASEVTTPKIEVTFDTQTQFLSLTVKDNGKGLTETDIERITDFERSYSTKFHYRYPTRGALGNALKCVLGMPYALTESLKVQYPRPPIQIVS